MKLIVDGWKLLIFVKKSSVPDFVVGLDITVILVNYKIFFYS